MPTFFEIPTVSQPQKFTIQLAGVAYKLTILYHAARIGLARIAIEQQTNLLVDQSQVGGWVLDIADANDVPIVAGIPLVTGVDLLAQYSYLNLGGALIVSIDGSDLVPTQTNLGTNGHLYFVTLP